MACRLIGCNRRIRAILAMASIPTHLRCTTLDFARSKATSIRAHRCAAALTTQGDAPAANGQSAMAARTTVPGRPSGPHACRPTRAALAPAGSSPRGASRTRYRISVDGHHPTDLVLTHAQIAEQEASRFRLSKLDRADLVQAGFVGLLIAAARFEPERGPFEAYARLWARKEMQRAIAASEFAAVVPANLIGRVVALRSLAQDTSALSALSGRLGLSEDTTRSLLNTLEVALPPGDIGAAVVGIDDSALLNVLGAALISAVGDLPSAERAAVVKVFGIGHDEPKSDRAAGRELGISPSTVRARVERALDRLRRTVRNDTHDTRSPDMNTTAHHLAWPDYGFAIDIPSAWEVFPGANNGSNEIARIKRDPAELSLTLIVWKHPAHGATLDAFAAGVRRALEAGGYKEFDVREVSVAGYDAHQLTGRQADGWTTRQYYFGGGTAVYVLGWGTADLAADEPDIASVLGTFRIRD